MPAAALWAAIRPAAHHGVVVGGGEPALRVVRRHDDGSAAVRDGPRDGVHEAMGLGVEPGVRLVEEEDGRAVQQGARDGDALLHAVGQGADAAVGPAFGADIPQDLGGALGRVRHGVEASVEEKVLDWREVVVEEVLVPDVADGRSHTRRVDARVEPADAERALVRFDERGDDAQQGALARAVVAEQREHAAPVGAQVYGAQRRDGAVRLRDALRLQGILGARGRLCVGV